MSLSKKVLLSLVILIMILIQQNSCQLAASNVSDEELEKLLEDKRYLMRQIKCALGEAACDPVGRRLKSLAPLVLRGACPKCSPGEKRQIQKTLSYVQRNYPKDWNRLMTTYAG